MLKIKNVAVYGLEQALIRSGYPHVTGEPEDLKGEALTPRDERRARKLGAVDSGSGHDCYLKGIIVQFDILYSGYLTPQLQRYHWIDVISSQSKMVSLKKTNLRASFNKYVDPACVDRLIEIQAEYREDPSYHNRMRLLSSLPHGFEQWMAVSTNYLQLKTIYHQRKNHRLVEDWGAFCRWCESLPRFSELVLKA